MHYTSQRRDDLTSPRKNALSRGGKGEERGYTKETYTLIALVCTLRQRVLVQLQHGVANVVALCSLSKCSTGPTTRIVD